MKKLSFNCLGAALRATAKNALGALAATASCTLTATALTFSALTATATPQWAFGGSGSI